jgi:hypothetical protein
MGRPLRESYEMMMKRGKLLNNPTEGKTVRKRPSHVGIEFNGVSVNKQLIVLLVDLMHFIGLTFLVTVLRDMRFITATTLVDRKKKTIWSALKQVINLYQSKGHTVEEVEFIERECKIHTILADNEFELLRWDIEKHRSRVNISSKEEHVPEVECQTE